MVLFEVRKANVLHELGVVAGCVGASRCVVGESKLEPQPQSCGEFGENGRLPLHSLSIEFASVYYFGYHSADMRLEE